MLLTFYQDIKPRSQSIFYISGNHRASLLVSDSLFKNNYGRVASSIYYYRIFNDTDAFEDAPTIILARNTFTDNFAALSSPTFIIVQEATGYIARYKCGKSEHLSLKPPKSNLGGILVQNNTISNNFGCPESYLTSQIGCYYNTERFGFLPSPNDYKNYVRTLLPKPDPEKNYPEYDRFFHESRKGLISFSPSESKGMSFLSEELVSYIGGLRTQSQSR